VRSGVWGGGGVCPWRGRTVIGAILVGACVSAANIAAANDADQSSTNSPAASTAASPAEVSAPPTTSTPAEQAKDAQPSSSENSTASVPPAADAPPPASLAIPDKPVFGDPVINKALLPPNPPAVTETAKAEPPPAKTPAELLGLTGKERVRAEKCLANAIYFEARGEPPRGQVAVAQVVMNRVFSPYYPKDVCGVVYQNAERHLACQFTFACDGLKKTYSEHGAWWRAQRIAKQTLDGKVWIASVAKSTHYHAYWVNPSWVAEMKKMWRYGVHTFYRPHRWGDGAQEAGWVKYPLPALGPKPNEASAPVSTTGATATAAAPPPVAATSSTTSAAPIAPATTASAASVAPKIEVKPLPKIDAKAGEAKAAASKADAKAAPAKIDTKKSDGKISPIYTDGKRSDVKPSPKPSDKPAAKVDLKAQNKNVQAKPAPNPQAKSTVAATKTPTKVQAKASAEKPKASATPIPAKSKATPKTADQVNPTRKL